MDLNSLKVVVLNENPSLKNSTQKKKNLFFVFQNLKKVKRKKYYWQKGTCFVNDLKRSIRSMTH